MSAEATIKDYRPKVSPQDRDDLMALASRLGFRISQPGTYEGEPSVRMFLAALAAAHRANPADVADALRQVGVINLPPNQS